MWTAFTVTILNLACDDAVCPAYCPTASPLTLSLPTRPFFGCFGAVYVRDVLPSCDDLPIPNKEASLELQHSDRNHTDPNEWKLAPQQMADWQGRFSHLEPGVKSSSSSPRNMLRCLDYWLTLQPTCKPPNTTTLAYLTRPYRSADCFLQLECFAIRTLNILANNRFCTGPQVDSNRRQTKQNVDALRAYWNETPRRSGVAAEVKGNCEGKR